MKSDCRVGKLKFIYSEKATKFGEISTIHLTGGDFAKFCDLFRIYELYLFLIFL